MSKEMDLSTGSRHLLPGMNGRNYGDMAVFPNRFFGLARYSAIAGNVFKRNSFFGRDLTRIQELDRLEMLARLLRNQVGQLTSYSYMAKAVRVSVDTIRRWIATLGSLHCCFTVRSWYKNVTRSLRKEPKYYLWDWSQLDDGGARAENMVANALLKAVHWWTEAGKGDFGLYFLRDKQQREIGFPVTSNQHPWFLAEVKSSSSQLSKSPMYFQKQTPAKHAFQVALDAEYVDRDCFEFHSPIIVPGKTFLSQLA